MSIKDFLNYEIILLLAKYGKKQVLDALASQLHIPSDVLETKLQEMGKLKPRITHKKRPDPSAIVESLFAQHPDKAEYLKTLFSRFQNKAFLTELKDVKRFYNRYADDLGKVKSRTDAIPKLFKLIASLDIKELSNLCDDFKAGEYSSLGILSEEIMKRVKQD